MGTVGCASSQSRACPGKAGHTQRGAPRQPACAHPKQGCRFPNDLLSSLVRYLKYRTSRNYIPAQWDRY